MITQKLFIGLAAAAMSLVALVGCGTTAATSQPTAVIVLATPRPTSIPATATPVPPTATSTAVPPTFTATPIPPTATATPIPMPEIKASIGTLIISNVSLAQGYPQGCDLQAEFGQPNACFFKPKAGWQILFVALKKVDGSEVRDLSEFYKGAYIIADDGTKEEVTIHGYVSGGDFEVGFTVSSTASKFKLFWPDNSPIDLDAHLPV